MKIYVDIDGTICTQEKDYRDAKPIPENIEKINKLFDQGNEIIYWTARGNSSGIDHYTLTKTQLCKWGCVYTVLIMNKPSFDLLIDDRTKRIEEI
jgi:hypothetical protein